MSLSREKINHLSQILTKGLTELPGGTLHAPENTIRLEIVRAMQDALKLEEEIETAVRRTLYSYTRKIPEGSREWDVMYQKLYDEELARRSAVFYRTLACLVEPIKLFLILLCHHLPFHFQRRRQFATLWRKIGWCNNKLFDGVIGGQLRVELGDACLDQLLDLRVRCEGRRGVCRDPVRLRVRAYGVEIKREDGRQIRTTVPVDHGLTDIGVGF